MTFLTLGTIHGLTPAEIRRLLRDLLDLGWNLACAYRTGDRVLVRVGLLPC